MDVTGLFSSSAVPAPAQGETYSNQTVTNTNNNNNIHTAAPPNKYAILFVGQLPVDCKEEDVRTVFGFYGNVLRIVLQSPDPRTVAASTINNLSGVGSSAFVSYATTKEADNAILSLHDKYSMDGRGRRLQVSYCLKTDKISTFGYQHAMQLHAINSSNPIPKIAPQDD
ncbi:RNA recognition motif. (a.k.a. RRM, RBD, or RNP domain), putative [Angomonas deanei]|uniref:RNA recognition motif. (A.k.a. RRM, RBD, or RNP domain), putative n=1 Tax=Angomonas deanei TaxID=59799 RepID=A0A7G2CFE4_9TRYP|nr:RNA recognition motif. (a.k.a. RRM, RBD, or RNP domain), putative [Angomonas deanei]